MRTVHRSLPLLPNLIHNGVVPFCFLHTKDIAFNSCPNAAHFLIFSCLPGFCLFLNCWTWRMSMSELAIWGMSSGEDLPEGGRPWERQSWGRAQLPERALHLRQGDRRVQSLYQALFSPQCPCFVPTRIHSGSTQAEAQPWCAHRAFSSQLLRAGAWRTGFLSHCIGILHLIFPPSSPLLSLLSPPSWPALDPHRHPPHLHCCGYHSFPDYYGTSHTSSWLLCIPCIMPLDSEFTASIEGISWGYAHSTYFHLSCNTLKCSCPVAILNLPEHERDSTVSLNLTFTNLVPSAVLVPDHSLLFIGDTVETPQPSDFSKMFTSVMLAGSPWKDTTSLSLDNSFAMTLVIPILNPLLIHPYINLLSPHWICHCYFIFYIPSHLAGYQSSAQISYAFH